MKSHVSYCWENDAIHEYDVALFPLEKIIFSRKYYYLFIIIKI